MAQSRSYLDTFILKVGIIYMLGAVGFGLLFEPWGIRYALRNTDSDDMLWRPGQNEVVLSPYLVRIY